MCSHAKRVSQLSKPCVHINVFTQHDLPAPAQAVRERDEFVLRARRQHHHGAWVPPLHRCGWVSRQMDRGWSMLYARFTHAPRAQAFLARQSPMPLEAPVMTSTRPSSAAGSAAAVGFIAGLRGRTWMDGWMDVESACDLVFVTVRAGSV